MIQRLYHSSVMLYSACQCIAMSLSRQYHDQRTMNRVAIKEAAFQDQRWEETRRGGLRLLAKMIAARLERQTSSSQEAESSERCPDAPGGPT